MEQLNYRPDDVAGAVSQSLDQPVGTVDAPKVESSEPIREMDNSQLVGAVSAGGGYQSTSATSVVDSGEVKRKRGRPARGQANLPPAKMNKEEEDVCFICFDGGSLVLCDRRGCPKAYHPTCIKRDDAFFQSKAKWNCGWHICSMCQKAAHHMCYTCTYSLCKGCIKKADYVCVRGDKGFCTICMRTIMLIENNVQGKEEMAQVDFDDKTSWEYLFKVYWVCLKEKLSLTMDELTRAKNPWKGSGTIGCERISPGVQNGANDIKCLQNGANDLKNLQNGGNAIESLTLDVSPDNLEANSSKRRKTDKQLNLLHEATPILEKPGCESGTLLVGSKEWATKELLEFVAHMRNGDTSALSQFDVQALMLEYIKKNNLRDPRLKSQILCDSRLYSLFGKPRVGHFEMLKLLEFHFPVNEDSQKNIVGAAAREVDPDWNNDSMLMVDKDKKRKPRRKGEERPPQANLDEYAAIDVHNINLIYLRRGLMENLLEDKEKFHLKVVGSIVRIRISSGDQKQDMYRLVQVVGTSKLDKPYKIGNKTTDVVLEVLNLNKKETVSADTISNQEFSEDECRRLRQSIRCGLVKHFTVGEILEKAVALQSVKLNDWLETEILRLNHLRDRASEKGKKRELRECVEKLELLKTPEERQRRLSEIPEVHADPKMNPECESEEDAAQLNDNKREEYMKTRHSGYRGNGSKSSSPQKRSEGSKNDTGGRVLYTENSVKARGKKQNEVICNNQAAVTSASFSVITSEKSASSLTMGNTLSAQESEADKMWHYRDPNGRVQGPFTMVQLQKWSTTGYFPTDMRIWANRQEDSVLLTDALKGEFHKALPYNAHLQSDIGSASYSKSNGYNVRRSENNSTQRVKNQSDGQSLLSQSSGQNWKTFSSVLGSNNLSSNLSAAAASVTKSTYVIEMNGAAVLSNLHSPTPRASHDNWEGQGDQKEGNADILDLPSPTPKTSSKADIVMDDREKPSEPSKLVVQDSGPTRSTASNLVVGGAQIAEIADEWGGYSPTPAKPSAGEWNSGDHVDTSKSNIDQFIHASQLHTVSTMSWQAIGSEPIEFSTLAEESVSDLLAEVDAMESQCGLPSPTSKRNFVDDLFHGSIEEFSCTPDQGARSDGFSSSGDMHLPCQSATPKELMGPSQGNLFSFLKSFLKRSKVDGEAKSSAAPVNHGQGMIRVESNAGVGTLTESSPRAEEAVGETQSSDVWVYVEEDAKPVGPTNSVDPNSAQKEKSEITVNWNNTTIQQGGAGGETVLESATRVEEKREIHSSNAPTTIQQGGSGTAVPECSVRAEKESEIKSIAVSVELEKREIKSCSDLVDPDIAVEDGAKVTDNVPNSTSIQQEGGNVRFKESAARAEREINSSEIIQPIQSAAPPLTTSQEPVDQSNAQRAGSSFGRQSPGTTNTGRGNANTGGRGSVGAVDSQQRYNGESYNGGPRDQGYNNQGRGTWNRQSYGGDGGGYSRPPVLPPPVPPAKGRRVCKFYESGRCKKGALCGYLHP